MTTLFQIPILVGAIALTPPITYDITTKAQEIIDFISKHDVVWSINSPWIECYQHGPLHLIKAYNGTIPSLATDFNYFHFDKSSPKVAPIHIDKSAIQVTDSELVYLA